MLKLSLFFLSTFIVHLFLPHFIFFSGWHHLSLPDYHFCHYYLYLPLCSASGEHADIQWNCNIWQEIEKGGGHLRKKRQRTKGLPKAIQLISAPCMYVSSSFFFFFNCVEGLKHWRCECCPKRQFKWWKTLCSTHKLFQTAVEMLLEK